MDGGWMDGWIGGWVNVCPPGLLWKTSATVAVTWKGFPYTALLLGQRRHGEVEVSPPTASQSPHYLLHLMF